jgi:RecA/RadA recombinase
MRRAARSSTPDLKELMASASTAVQQRFKAVPVSAGRASHVLKSPDQFFSLGSIALDRLAAGHNPGGVPAGRVVHIAGWWSLGKSLLLDHLFASVQRAGGVGLCSESEGTRDPYFPKLIGCDLSLLEIQYPDTIEQMFDAAIAWHDAFRAREVANKRAHAPIVWGIDSLDSAEAEKSAAKGLTEGGGWKYGGGKSEALGAGLRKAIKRCRMYPTTLVMLNQVRVNPAAGPYGQKTTTSGGHPPHFYASLEIELDASPLGDARSPAIKLPSSFNDKVRRAYGLPKTDPRGETYGRWVRAKVSKTKLALTQNRHVDFFIDFRQGIRPWHGLLPSLLLERRVLPHVKAKGGWEGFDVLALDGQVQTHVSDERTLCLWLRDHPEWLATPVGARSTAAAVTAAAESTGDQGEEDTDGSAENPTAS